MAIKRIVKVGFFLMSIIGIPMIFEISSILHIWLGTPPDNAAMFSAFFILALLFDSMTIGLTHVNNAIGNIGKYILTLNTPKFITFFFVFVALKFDASLYVIGIIYVFVEAVTAFVRVPLIKEQAGLDVSNFFKTVVFREIFPAFLCTMTCLLSVTFFSFQWRFVLTFFLSASIYTAAMYFWGLTSKERKIIIELFDAVKAKFINR